MAVMSGEILKCRPFCEERAPCGGRNFLPHKAGGRISVRVCNSSNNNDGSVHSDNKNAGLTRRRRREDVILPCDVDNRGSMTWWLPLFGWSQTDQEPWEDNNNELEARVMDKSSGDPEKELEEGAVPRRSKFVRGRLTAEKAKLLRKNLRDTSTFHDIMYHSAIASRLASPDNEGFFLHIESHQCFHLPMAKGKGRQVPSSSAVGLRKRGQKTHLQTLETLANSFAKETPPEIREAIHGWECATDIEKGDLLHPQAEFTFLTDPGSTRGRQSLFQQFVHTYWKMKCVLEKSMLSQKETQLSSTILFEIHQLKKEMHDMAKLQGQVTARLDNME